MTDLILITSANEGGKGMCVNDLNGSALANNFKDCVTDTGAMCVVGGASSYAGQGSTGDYIVAAQSKKPIINVYHWGKPQVHYQCHVQEITTSLAADTSGSYLFGGTKRGWIYCWEIATGKLLTSFQAHFKAVTQLHVTARGEFFISASEDGMVRAWDLCDVIAKAEMSIIGGGSGSTSNTKNSSSSSGGGGTKPFRSWSPHTLPIKGMYVAQYGSSIRVLTCSLDRTVVIHDIYTNKQCHRMAFPHALSSLTCNSTSDYVYVGTSEGNVFIVDLSVSAMALTTSNAAVASTSTSALLTVQSNFSNTAIGTGIDASTASTSVIDAHSKQVNSLSVSSDNVYLVTGSEDGSVKIWNIISHQCTHVLNQPRAVSNVMVLPKPEIIINTTIYRPKLSPFEHLKKYTEATKSGVSGSGAGNIAMLPPGFFGSTAPVNIKSGVGVDIVGGNIACALRDEAEARLGAGMSAHLEEEEEEEEGGGGSDDDDDDKHEDDDDDKHEDDDDDDNDNKEVIVPATKTPLNKNKKRRSSGASTGIGADLTDSTEFLSFAASPEALLIKRKKKK